MSIGSSIHSTETTSSEIRTRTSSRITICNTILSLIESGITGNDLTTRIIAMRDNPVVIQAKSGAGNHYVVVDADNNRVHMQSAKMPIRSDKIASCYGPFKTKKGAEYVVSNGARATDKRIF